MAGRGGTRAEDFARFKQYGEQRVGRLPAAPREACFCCMLPLAVLGLRLPACASRNVFGRLSEYQEAVGHEHGRCRRLHLAISCFPAAWLSHRLVLSCP